MAGNERRVRCAAHEGVVDAGEWSANPVGFLFESTDEAVAHFLQDYGDGLDMMQEAQRKGVFDEIDDDEEEDEDKGKRH